MIWSPQQDAALLAVKRWLAEPAGKPFFYLAGFAGSGKSTLASTIAADHGGRVGFGAYTGKAASVMRAKGCAGATTIHRMIYARQARSTHKLAGLHAALRRAKETVPPDHAWIAALEADVANEEKSHRRPKFEFAGASSKWDLIVIDECSMADQTVGTDLLSLGVPVLALGDPAQLPPVAGGGFFTGGEPDALLTEVHRQAWDSPVLRMATIVREGGNLELGDYGSGAQLCQVLAKAPPAERVMEHEQVICGTNARRRAINVRMREVAGRKSPLPEAGDKLICLRNDHEVGVMNGEIWWAMSAFDQGAISIASEDETTQLDVAVHEDAFLGREVSALRRMDALEFDYGNCITGHKCVSPSTLVSSSAGLLPIVDVPIEATVDTVVGPKKRGELITLDDQEMLRITTHDGYEVEVTRDHGMNAWTGAAYERIDARNLEHGQFLRLFLGCFADFGSPVATPVGPENPDVRAVRWRLPEFIDLELAEFLGLMVADGTVWDKGFRLAKNEVETTDRFCALCVSLFGVQPRRWHQPGPDGGAHFAEVSSVWLSDWLRRFDGINPNRKAVSAKIMQSSLPVQAAFLRGLFEDGSVSARDCTVELSTSVESIARTVQVMLLRWGIISSRRNWSRAPHGDRWAVYINNHNAKRFGREIGFVSPKKTERLAAHRPHGSKQLVPFGREESCADKSAQANGRARGYLTRSVAGMTLAETDDRMRFHHDKILRIEPFRGPAACFSVPGHGRFLQNGFDGFNSQGSEWRSVLVFDESRCFRDQARRWLYTALTRASERVTVVRAQ